MPTKAEMIEGLREVARVFDTAERNALVKLDKAVEENMSLEAQSRRHSLQLLIHLRASIEDFWRAIGLQEFIHVKRRSKKR